MADPAWAQPQLKDIEAVIKACSPVTSEFFSKDASLDFTSSLALAFNIVFGKTKPFGRIINDPDMGSLEYLFVSAWKIIIIWRLPMFKLNDKVPGFLLQDVRGKEISL